MKLHRVLSPPSLLALAALAATVGVAIFLLTRPALPDEVASAYLKAWSTGNRYRMHELSTPAGKAASVKTEFRMLNIPNLAESAVVRSARVISKAQVEGDVAVAPASARFNGPATARALAQQFPVPMDSNSVQEVGGALERPFSFQVGLVRSQRGWKMDSLTTFTSLGGALQQDRTVHQALQSVLQRATESLWGG